MDAILNSVFNFEVNIFWVRFFRRTLFGFLILKLLLIWSTLDDLITYIPFNFNSILRKVTYAPILLANFNSTAFLISFIALLLAGIFLSHRNTISCLIFWFSVSLSKLAFPISNGSDTVLNLFLFLSIFIELPQASNFSNLNKLISKSTLIVARIHLALIYFLSGYDKLLSEAWRSGAAFFSITHLTYFQNPNFILELSKLQCLLLAWVVIFFEIGFSILIWFRKLRPTLLILGCIFHASIIIFLGLLDFGLIMIICYCLFLPIQNQNNNQSQFSKSV
jgi:uncharacterized membrane protein YphA (DoxX/SURF4 family)